MLFLFYTIPFLLIVSYICTLLLIRKIKNQNRLKTVEIAIKSNNIINDVDAYKLYKAGKGSIFFRIHEPYENLLLFCGSPGVTSFPCRIEWPARYYMDHKTVQHKIILNENMLPLSLEKFKILYPDVNVAIDEGYIVS